MKELSVKNVILTQPHMGGGLIINREQGFLY